MNHIFKLCLLLLILGVFVMACDKKKSRPKPPDTVLNEKQMTAVIYDLHIVDGILTSGIITAKNLKPDSVMYHSVFVKHKTTSKMFQASVLYYTQNDMPGFRIIYTGVVDSLNKTKAELMGWN